MALHRFRHKLYIHHTSPFLFHCLAVSTVVFWRRKFQWWYTVLYMSTFSWMLSVVDSDFSIHETFLATAHHHIPGYMEMALSLFRMSDPDVYMSVVVREGHSDVMRVFIKDVSDSKLHTLYTNIQLGVFRSDCLSVIVRELRTRGLLE